MSGNEPASKSDIKEIKDSITLLFDCVNSIKDNISNYKEKVAENYITQGDCENCSSKKETNINSTRSWIIGLYGTSIATFVGMVYWVSEKFQIFSDKIETINSALAKITQVLKM